MIKQNNKFDAPEALYVLDDLTLLPLDDLRIKEYTINSIKIVDGVVTLMNTASKKMIVIEDISLMDSELYHGVLYTLAGRKRPIVISKSIDLLKKTMQLNVMNSIKYHRSRLDVLEHEMNEVLNSNKVYNI